MDEKVYYTCDVTCVSAAKMSLDLLSNQHQWNLDFVPELKLEKRIKNTLTAWMLELKAWDKEGVKKVIVTVSQV